MVHSEGYIIPTLVTDIINNYIYNIWYTMVKEVATTHSKKVNRVVWSTIN